MRMRGRVFQMLLEEILVLGKEAQALLVVVFQVLLDEDGLTQLQLGCTFSEVGQVDFFDVCLDFGFVLWTLVDENKQEQVASSEQLQQNAVICLFIGLDYIG